MVPADPITAPRIYPLGDSALACEFDPPATLGRQRRVWTIAQAARAWPHIVEVVPGMNNLTLVFDPLQIDPAALEAHLAEAFRTEGAERAPGNLVEIPVRYGGEFGPDLEIVARHAGLSPAEVVKRHTDAEYIVFFLGFQPGFAYLGGLDPRLATPRRAVPRIEVPAGSVGIGGAQTAIYPVATPGGWQLIGRSEIVLFDPSAAQPSALQPGDRVRFHWMEPPS